MVTNVSLLGGSDQAANLLEKKINVKRKTWKTVTPNRVKICPKNSANSHDRGIKMQTNQALIHIIKIKCYT